MLNMNYETLPDLFQDNYTPRFLQRRREKWLQGLDLHQRPSVYETDELPTALLRDDVLFYSIFLLFRGFPENHSTTQHTTITRI